MWGLFNHSIKKFGIRRFIPTHVGFIYTGCPHRCHYCGSSPRMWGLFPGRKRETEGRPVHPHACGVYAFRRNHSCKLSVHPHACGVYTALCAEPLTINGSSPRMWGLCDCLPFVTRILRFIPTHVGFIRGRHHPHGFPSVHPHACGVYARHSPRTPPVPVHPHACGVYFTVLSSTFRQYGSSPRMWGLCDCPPVDRLDVRGSSPRMWGL